MLTANITWRCSPDAYAAPLAFLCGIAQPERPISRAYSKSSMEVIAICRASIAKSPTAPSHAVITRAENCAITFGERQESADAFGGRAQ
jgi:hypothetical protein